MSESSHVELCVRYNKQDGIYDFRTAEDSPIVQFTEDQTNQVLLSLHGDEAKHAVMKFLFEQAKKDPNGNWIEASSAPTVPGQGEV